MCLLTFFPQGVVVTDSIEEMLHCGCTRNQDGFGWAIALPNAPEPFILVGKYLTATAAVESFREARAAHPDSVALFHSRLATAGAEDLRGVHPFAVDGDLRTVVAHNGVLPTWAQPDRKDWRSDTRILADEFVVREALGLRRYREALGRQIKGDKLVFLTVDPMYSRNAYIVNADHGEWAEGAWWSNDGYKKSRSFVWTSGDYTGWEDSTPGWPKETASVTTGLGALVRSEIDPYRWYNPYLCVVCKGTQGYEDSKRIIDPQTELCRFCRSCALCKGSYNECECWDNGRNHRNEYAQRQRTVNVEHPVPGARALAAQEFWADWSDAEIDEMVSIACNSHDGCTVGLSDEAVHALSDDEWNELMIKWIDANPERLPEWYWYRTLPDGSFRWDRGTVVEGSEV